VRRFAVIFAVAGLVVALAAPASAAAHNRPVEYLALGDSLAFGFNPYVSPADPTGFKGYPEAVGHLLRDKVANASCPGETSSHFIDLAAPDHGCGDWRFGYRAPLHVAYAGSQLAFMDHFLKSHPKVRLVTIDIGANDVGALRDECMKQGDPITCFQAGMPAMLATLSANLDTIYRHLRIRDGYRHKLVALTVYSPNYADPLTTGAIAAVNQVVTERTLAWHGIVADGFGAFAAATASYSGSSCDAGLLIPLAPPPGCDDHPSAAGRDLLAKTIVSALRAH
jgi:lysophospholipase L1-like esterase